jgi:hypothetical protein
MLVTLKETNLLLLVNHPDATLEVESPYNLSDKQSWTGSKDSLVA